MDAKHTKTPWDLVPQNDGSSILARFHEDRSKGFRIVGHILLRKDSQVEDAANAAFIVRAVNAHDDLVKALKAINDFWSDVAENQKSGACLSPSALLLDNDTPIAVAVSAALAKAGQP